MLTASFVGLIYATNMEETLTAEGAMVMGIVIGSGGDLISRLEEFVPLLPLLCRDDDTRIDLGARMP